MMLRHVALVCSSEENSDRFYQNLLGLEKSEPKILARPLSKAIFNVDTELMMINYRGEQVHFEIFITDPSESRLKQIGHVCLEIEDLNAFLNECHHLEIEVNQVPKGDKTLTFIRDPDGNLFEIKS